MEGTNREALAMILLKAPAWAQIGLTVRHRRLREQAAHALAATILERLEPTLLISAES